MSLKIWLSKEAKVILRDKFDVSPSTISQTLNYKRNGLLHSNIRCFAVNHLHGKFIKIS